MTKNIFSLEEIYLNLKRKLEEIDGDNNRPNHMVIRDKLYNKYLVAEINLKDCIKNDQIYFSCYYSNDENNKSTNICFGVSFPVELYAGIELYPSLPIDLEKKYKGKCSKIGF